MDKIGVNMINYLKKNWCWEWSISVLTVIICTVIFFGHAIFTSAGRTNLTSYGKNFHVTLYNGGKEVRAWDSIGKVFDSESDGWYFEDAATRKLVRVSGNVVVEER